MVMVHNDLLRFCENEMTNLITCWRVKFHVIFPVIVDVDYMEKFVSKQEYYRND